MSASLDVLFLIRSLHIGGAERQLALLARTMHASGHRVRVATFYASGAFEADLRQAGVPVLDLKKSGRWDVLTFFWRLVRLLRKEKPVIVHGYLPMSNLLALLAKPFAGWPKVVWGIRSSGSDPRHYGWMGRLEAWLQARLSRWADLIICNSQRGRQYALSQGFPLARTVCVPNGVNCEQFFPDPAAGLRTREAWGISQDVYLIGIVGRFVPLKNHAGLLRAAAPLLLTQPCAVVCIGSGSSQAVQEMRALAVELGIADKVFFPGAHLEMCAAYNALDLFVSASLTEGAPNVLGEAMACNLPVICTDVGDAAWLAADYGQVVSPGDVPALEHAILHAYACRKIPRASPRERVLSAFSVMALAANTETLLRNVCTASETKTP